MRSIGNVVEPHSPSFFTPDQQRVAGLSPGSKVAVFGDAGSGKTTASVELLANLVSKGVDPGRILVLTPQRSLGLPYLDRITSSDFPGGGIPTVITMGGLAQRTIQLFWPLILGSNTFTGTSPRPVFLTLETAQYFMSKIIEPYRRQGFFEHLIINSNRLAAQILDNMNKSALMGIFHNQFAPRLSDAWSGKPDQLLYYQQAQTCANEFREECYKNNLLDFSLQFELFHKQLWHNDSVRKNLTSSFDFLIYDNVEEDAPAIHDIVLDWLPLFAGYALIQDSGGGFRSFLGADPISAQRLMDSVDANITMHESVVSSESVLDLRNFFVNRVNGKLKQSIKADLPEIYTYSSHRFYPDMLEAAADQIAALVKASAEPGQIAVVMPYLSDSLLFTLGQHLSKLGLPYRSHRPSRAPLNDPIIKALFTLAKVTHPDWNAHVTPIDIRWMLNALIHGLDIGRAELLANQLFTPTAKESSFKPFSAASPPIRERVTFVFGERYDLLTAWLSNIAAENLDLDILFTRAFGEILSQPGFTLHNELNKAHLIANLIESIQKFRDVLTSLAPMTPSALGLEYITAVETGIISAFYIADYAHDTPNEVLITPAFSFLMANRPVQHQIWLDIGSEGWWTRVYQPLTHPYVLSRNWITGSKWTDADEDKMSKDSISRIIHGLLNRTSVQ
ncbi:MAG TPA: hypothetical protein PKD55_01675, partial [Bellilinea sp.]|nr:hypothetical protein [Bellilinea sp.]